MTSITQSYNSKLLVNNATIAIHSDRVLNLGHRAPREVRGNKGYTGIFTREN